MQRFQLLSGRCIRAPKANDSPRQPCLPNTFAPHLSSAAGCELYAFCGALFGICSMMTLMVIAVDRYVVITRPLASLGVMSRRKALSIVAAAWVYSMGWSLPPFFGWSEYDLELISTVPPRGSVR